MPQSSLLAHLYPYFKGSQEDVATSSLSYIVSCNEYINRAFTQHIGKTLQTDIPETYQYKCQAVGENKERPDIAGYDANGDERILCESKFYAALTVNQPNAYIKRLIEEKGIGLMFICPDIRKKGLWNEILILAAKEYRVKKISDFCVELNDSVHLGITTWKDVLSDLEQIASGYAIDCVPDIKQLQGYCEQLNREAFIPFNAEDFGIDRAMKAERPYILLDALVEALKNDPDHNVRLNNLKATPIWSGYRRYLFIDDFAVNLEYDTAKWRSTDNPNTPFWLYIKKAINDKWQQDDQCRKAMLKIPPELKSGTYIALFPKCYVALSEAVEDMKKQVYQYIQLFKET